MADPNDLVQMLASLHTSDRDTLTSQFSKILQCDSHTAEFFLESSNWNVELAVNTYLSTTANRGLQGTGTELNSPQAVLLSDLSGVHGKEHPLGAQISMVWSFGNTGTAPWPASTILVFCDGESLGVPQRLQVGPIGPSQKVDIPVQLSLPSSPGTFAGSWRLAAPGGYFGEPLWMIVTVSGGDGDANMAGNDENVGMACDDNGGAGGDGMLPMSSSTETPAAMGHLSTSQIGSGATNADDGMMEDL